ncbi:RagB/SusD family nutrient uptake outer membrane protein [Mariniflexile sp. AS56]|uniref:RagB/SusD family nutrient uptake outer membrane protein n=1 Tax=Mariniflexile sp. AS56 TaxID=3063957 RepID=UPI0026ED1EDE|nr:RagB/SusD family nutrient uptake outer membrane protein [Mariniflexile sp. AS56]MDO7170753.1 RagB/SusD family nutrient uptake outer membrane protein [Mariniflexile sp. AS56]
MKINFLNKYLFIAILTAGLTSCDSDEFLDGPVPTDSVTSIAVYGSKAGIESAMTGTFNVLRDYFASHDTNGAKAYYLGADVMGTDVTCPDFNWYIFETRWDVVDSANGRRTNWAWEMYYSIANACRSHIAGINGSSAITDAEKVAYIAELQALEAHCYFNLSRYYSGSYAGAGGSQPGIPLYTEPQSVNNVGNPRGTLEDVYTRIITQLEDAIPNIPVTQTSKYRFSRGTAQGVLARIYLEKGDWVKAEFHANKAKDGYPLMDAGTYAEGFNSIDNNEWMWGLPFNAEQQSGFARFWSFIDHSSNGYNDLYIGVDFQATFTSDSDIRKNLIVVNDADSNFKRYVTAKFRDNADQSGDLIMMRSSEMWMIEAEALAEQNKLPEAKAALLAVLSKRDPSATLSTATTKEALVDEILLERRKEFYGELGLGYFDLKRRNKGLVRTGPNQQWQLTVPAGDSRWRFYIPQSEIDRNPNMTEADQN